MSNEVTLKEFRGTLAECELISGWRNNPDNSRWFPKQDAWTGTSCWAWYNEVYVRDPSQNLYWVLRDLTPIGTVGMTIRNGSGELERMMLGDKNLARGGYMRQGMRQLMAAYGMNHYWLRVMPDNEATIRFHQRNGFTKLTTPGGKYENVLGEVDEYLVMSRSNDGYWPEVPVK